MAQAVREARGLCEPLRVVLTVGEVEREGVREGDRVVVGEGVLLALGVEERERGGVRLPLPLPVPVDAAVTEEE